MCGNASGKCIPKRWQCDYHKDCENGEDEYDCRKYIHHPFCRPGRTFMDEIGTEYDTIAKWNYSPVRLRLNGRVTRFMFSAAISKSLELKRSSIAL